MAKKVEENIIKNTEVVVKEVEVIKEIEVIKEVIVQQKMTAYDLYEQLSNDPYLKSFVNDFFKHYLNLGFIELNALLNTNNCVQFLSPVLNDLLHCYLLCFKMTTKTSSKFDKIDNLKNLTHQLRLLYPFSNIISQHKTLLFETKEKKYFVGSAYKFYSIDKEVI